MGSLDMISNSFNIIFIISIIIFVLIFGFTIVMIFSSKFRGKMMSKQIKAVRNMTDISKEDFGKIQENMVSSMIDAKKKNLDKYQDVLEDMVKREANISKEGIRIKTKAVADGLRKTDGYCKYCGEAISEDSVYCSKCGKNLFD